MSHSRERSREGIRRGGPEELAEGRRGLVLAPGLPVLVACCVYSTALVALSVVPRPPAVLPDVVAHAVASGVQAGLFYLAAASVLSPLGAILSAWLGTTAFAAGSELLQSLLPPRAAELHDLVAAMVGATAVLAGALGVRLAAGAVDAFSGSRGDGPASAHGPTSEGGLGDDVSNGETCIHCREPIRPGARRCPSCLAWQSRWAGDSQNPRLELAFLIGGAIAAAFLAAVVYGVGRSRNPSPSLSLRPDAMSVPEPVSVVKPPGGRGGIAVVGTIRNPTRATWRDPYLQVTCRNRDGNTIDAFAARAGGVVVPSNGSASFKVVEATTLQDPAEYAACRVEVRWAVRAD
ncbi:MAG TPA: FxLYD domain-containing protein [Thermoanaerobaculia bacterium]|nr:FxLYD domain-containing protein [Thermoanaerobaculia bacterium]